MSFTATKKVYTSTNKTTIVWIETELFHSPGMDASHVYVRALALGCFYSHISTRTFRRALTDAVGQMRGDKECPFSGVTKSGRVWRKVPESGARSISGGTTHWASLSGTFLRHLPPNFARIGYTTEGAPHTLNIAFRHLPPRKAVVNQWLEFGGTLIICLRASVYRHCQPPPPPPPRCWY